MKFAVPSGVALAALLAGSSAAFAQHEQMPGMSQSAANAGSCAQNSQAVTRGIDEVNARVEEARQLNDPTRMRAAIGDLQLALTQMKVQLADCVSLATDAGGAMGNMPGMDHPKMPAQPNAPQMQPGSNAPAPAAKGAMPAMPGMDHSKMAGMEPAKPKPAAADVPKKAEMDHSKMPGMEPAKPKPTTAAETPKPAEMDHSKMGMDKAAPGAAPKPAKAVTSSAVVVALRTQPAPPRSGNNDFEVTIKDAEGKPIADADVSLVLYMPAMPSMNMPAARSTVKLTSAGNGAYKGSGAIGMAGDWDATITAARKGEQLASKTMKLTVK